MELRKQLPEQIRMGRRPRMKVGGKSNHQRPPQSPRSAEELWAAKRLGVTDRARVAKRVRVAWRRREAGLTRVVTMWSGDIDFMVDHPEPAVQA
jgi:hypothetical protein